ncbi:superfamily II DNA or RNA helicase [Kibdelosporangium banguiense]|uniref:Superfamily II DNA or RNA helicase n=1 Tax=Kibdelosporangium banguiense TaxID=1365924 RepID=A0ABS4TP54_9PSEU|nr:DEAD/DEAH box helicase [Kibdelosporangium banguiense]MBP2326182.1 superfamily II DNA or RNA helicase [Kibdelosporangium banguiense]
MTLGVDVAGLAAVFQPADPARLGVVSFWDPDDGALPDGDQAEIDIAQPDGTVRTLAALRMPVAEAIPVLVGLRDNAHPATRFWAAATAVALHLVARGRLLPGVSSGGFDAWRAGPLDLADMTKIRALADAMPATARAVPVEPGSALLPDRLTLLRAYLDAVADTLPRTPAAPWVAGGQAFAGQDCVQVPELREWAGKVSAGVDSGVRVALIVDVPDGDFDSATFRANVQLRSLADPTLVADAADIWSDTDHGFGDQARTDAMIAVRRAASLWAPLKQLLDLAVPDAVDLIDQDIDELLAEMGPRLAAAGVEVHWPPGLDHDLASATLVSAPEEQPAQVADYFAGPAELAYSWQLTLPDGPLTDDEMDAVAKARRPVVRLRDRWVLVEPELGRRARDRALPALPAMEALRRVLIGTGHVGAELVPVLAEGWLARLRDLVAEPAEGPEPLVAPGKLQATLREYQLRGVRWLDRMTSLGFGCCLADDMGLGKTITLIGLHLTRQQRPATAGPTLVVCPASLLGNWEREIARFAPGTPVHRYHGGARTLAGVESGFVLTTYATMRLDAQTLATREWSMVVTDEAQHVKNRLSGTAKALREIPAGTRIAMTGTPVENTLSELWAILDWTTPGLLGTISAFQAGWATVETGRDSVQAGRLATLLRPFLLRRRKSDPGIAPELPPKTETDQIVELTAEQAKLYRTAVRDIMREIRGAGGIARHGLILKLLTALKQICNHPAHYAKETTGQLTGRSGKLEVLDELLETIIAEGSAALVFTQYVQMARLLERHLTERGISTQLLHGGTPVARREEMVQAFQNGDVPVFLLSLKAAGTGLNLTRADHVIHYDRWWNPAVEDQATDRAHRIGQTRSVQVHRLIAEGTLEDRIAALLESKKELADAILTGGDAAFSQLSDAELTSLVELRSTL